MGDELSDYVDEIGTAATFGVIAVWFVLTVLSIWAAVRILRQAGYSGWWYLITLVPVVNLVMFYVFAFTEFPVRRELRAVRAQYAASALPQASRFGTPPPVAPYVPPAAPPPPGTYGPPPES